MTPAAALLFLALAPAARQEAIPLRDYRARLAAAREALDRGDLEAARRAGRELLGRRVRHEGGDFAADPSVLGPLSKADAEGAPALSGRLAALVSALDALAAEPGAAPPPDERALLERLRREQAWGEARKGGTVAGLPDAPPPPRTFVERLEDFFEWLNEKAKAFLRWLRDLFFPDRMKGGAGGLGVPLVVAILVILLVAAVGTIAIVALRRKRAAARGPEARSAPARSARDEDPLSRNASEWERFAQDLARAGRYREAIRAWYHAVLVTLFRAGLLHYRKDRTNWEYAFALGPGHAWRPEFLEATRSFEREWYGRRDTPEDAAGEYERQARRILSVVREAPKE